MLLRDAPRALAALALSFAGIVSAEHPARVPLSILGGTAAVLLAWWRLPSVHAFFAGLGLQAFLAPHVLRAIVGAGFLVEYSRGMLPEEFALRAGVGDIIADVLAALAMFIPERAAWRPKALWLVNAMGLVDILIVLVTAQRILSPHCVDEGHEPRARSAAACCVQSTLPLSESRP